MGSKLIKNIRSVGGGLKFKRSCSSSFYLYENSQDETQFLIENLAEGKVLQHRDIPTKLSNYPN